MTKKRKAVIVGASALVVVGLTVGFMAPGGSRQGSGSNGGASVRTVTLSQGDMASSVSATGTIYSASSTEVYSNLSYPVKTVHVTVGDRVEAGDLLAELDTASLESDIAQKTASISASQATAQQNLAVAQRELESYERDAENGYDSSLLSASSGVTSAELDLQTAELDLHNAELDLQNAELDVQSAGQEVRSARNNLNDARRGEGDYEEVDATDAQISSLQDALYAKETALEKAQANLEKAQSNLEKSQASLEKYKANLEKAETTNEAAKVSSGDSLTAYQEKVKSAQLSTNFNDQWIAVQKLQDDLASATITAPVSGTVTAVNAVEGGSGNGLLFILQDTDNLKVVTNIKEYDIEAVAIGDKVTIKTDATGDKEFTGRLAKIAPTSTLTATGATTTSTDAEFESEVTVSAGEGLRVGMNARLSIITEEKQGVFSVPYEAIVEQNGESFVYVQNAGEGDTVTYTMLPVAKGLETDLYVEISGDGLAEGMEVVKNASSVDASLVEGGAAPAVDAPDMAGGDGTDKNSDGARPAGIQMGGPPARME